MNMKTPNRSLLSVLLLAGIIGCAKSTTGCSKSVTGNQNPNKQASIVPITVAPTPQTFDVDMEGLLVSMPGETHQAKFVRDVPNVGTITSYQADITKENGVFIVGTDDFALVNGLEWNPTDIIDDRMRSVLDDWSNDGYQHIVLSDEHMTIAGLDGRMITTSGKLDVDTMIARFMVLAENTTPRLYVFIAVTKDIADEDVKTMLQSIRRKQSQ